MNKIISSLFFLIVTYGHIQANDACTKYSCKKFTKVKICLVDPDLYKSTSRKISTKASCGYSANLHIVSSRIKIKEVMDKYAKGCNKVTSLNIATHGSPGYQGAGKLHTKDINKTFSGYGCLMAKKAKIHTDGCNAGSGCSGQIFMYQMAKNLLSPNGGSITAATTFTSTFIPGVIPHFSINGSSRKLTYNQNQKPKDVWDQTGLAVSSGGSLISNCLQESEDAINKYKKMRQEKEFSRCSHLVPSYSKNYLARLKQCVPHLKKGNTKSTEEVLSLIGASYDGEDISTINKITESVNQCISEEYWDKKINDVRKVIGI